MAEYKKEYGGLPPQSKEMRKANSALLGLERLKDQVTTAIKDMTAENTRVKNESRKTKERNDLLVLDVEDVSKRLEKMEGRLEKIASSVATCEKTLKAIEKQGTTAKTAKAAKAKIQDEAETEE